MNPSFEDIIRRHCRPLEPIPTSEQPVLRQLAGVRAVLFDIYGTLLISASGDIATSQGVAKGYALVEAMRAVGIHFQGDGEVGTQLLLDEIAADHERAREAGIEYPEVDIVDVWRRTVVRLMAEKSAVPDGPGSSCYLNDMDLRRLALEYEIRVNPVWRMPHAPECLEKLHHAGFTLGVVSNAQFLTIELWRSLLRPDTSDFEFDEELQYYSYQHGRAKPGIDLFELAAKTLAERGVHASEVLYVGNDMLNDVMPAHLVGFCTALFAGDARSLRRREGDPRVADVVPQIVITDLFDLPKCIC